MQEALALAQKVATVGFGPLMALILIGSYYEIWVWGRKYREEKAETAARLAAVEKERDEWKRMALRTTGLLETSVDHLAAGRRG